MTEHEKAVRRRVEEARRALSDDMRGEALEIVRMGIELEKIEQMKTANNLANQIGEAIWAIHTKI